MTAKMIEPHIYDDGHSTYLDAEAKRIHAIPEKAVGLRLYEQIYDEARPHDVAIWEIVKITPKTLRVRRIRYLSPKEITLYLDRTPHPFRDGHWEVYRNRKHFVSWCFKGECDGERGERECGFIDPRRGCAERGCEVCRREVEAFDEAKTA